MEGSNNRMILARLLKHFNENKEGLVETIENQAFYQDILGVYDKITYSSQHLLLEMEELFDDQVKLVNLLLSKAIEDEWDITSQHFHNLIDAAMDLDNIRRDIIGIQWSALPEYEREDYDN